MNKESKMIKRDLAESYFAEDTTGRSIDCRTDLIRKRAYELYMARGNAPGRSLDDWLQAEWEIDHRLNAAD